MEFMSKLGKSSLFALGALIATTGPASSNQSGQHIGADPFERGRVFLDAGNVTDALDLWLRLKDSLSAIGSEDPRIGVAFIASVARDNLDLYEEAATLMFYWGLSGFAPSDQARHEILAEGRRTFALVDSTTATAWDAFGRGDPVSMALAIKQFWIERDPTPATLLNERLLEHWSRIEYARANYVYNRESPFGTDDRGVIYVKYGRPVQITAGHLGVSSAEARWRGITKEALFRWDVEPLYEIWRYGIFDEREFTYFMFGNEDGTGPFRLVTGVHEIIPTSSRSGPGSRIAGIRAQYFLELFYHIDLARAGGPYGIRLSELEALWNQRGGLPNEGYLEAISRRHIEDDIQLAARPRAPAWSEIDDSPKSALSAQVARVMQNGQPHLLALAVSSPLWALEFEANEFVGELSLDDYTPTHTVIARNQRLDEIARFGMVPLDAEGQLSTVVLRHDPRIGHVSVAASHDMDARETPGRRLSTFPGHRHFSVAAPLALDPVARFEASDIMVGIAPHPGVATENSPVPLLPATRFWRNDLLRVYFEIYRPLGTPASQATIYDVRLQVVPIPQAQLGEDLPRPPSQRERDGGRAAVSVDVESTGSLGRHFFDLDLRNETPGPLRLVLEVGEPESGIIQTRSIVVLLLDR